MRKRFLTNYFYFRFLKVALTKLKFCKSLFLWAICLFAACNDPVFYTVSQEVEPVDPRIDGSPSNFAIFKNEVMYVASGSRLFKYEESNNEYKWSRERSPGGKILQIAATEKYLYALCYEDSDTRTRTFLRRFDAENAKWETLGGNMMYIYAAKDTVFIGDESSNSYTIFYAKDETEEPSEAIKNLNLTGEITGAAFDGTNYYLCTTNGIYWTADPSAGAESIDTSSDFKGMISLGNGSIAAITRGGNLHIITGTDDSGSVANLGDRLATGALAVWEDKDDPSRRLLLAGRQDRLVYSIDSGYTYGYLELELGDSETASSFREPGSRQPSSVDDNERYISTIGKHPVNHICQAPDGILFASTQKNGVWSYRSRSGVPQWNAEE